MKRSLRVALATLSLLVIAGLADAGAALAARGNVLVLARATNGSEGGVAASALRSLGYTVALTEALPEKLSSYSSIWSIRAYEGFSPGEEEALEGYVRGGGHLYLTGERPCCESLNTSDESIARAVLKNQGIVIGGQGDIGGELSFNPLAADEIASSPNGLTNFLSQAPGGITGIGGPTSKNVLASNGTTATAAAFDEKDMVSGKGRLVIYMDIDWLVGSGGGGVVNVQRAHPSTRLKSSPPAVVGEGGGSESTRLKVIQNIEDFLERTPTRLNPNTAEYVGLGDSYASGLGSFSYLPGTTGKNGCYRATNGYIEEVSADFGLTLDFAACAGATIGDLWEGTNAQLKQVGPETRLVTLSIGGNDVGFSSVLQSCIGGLVAKGGKGCAAKDTPAAETALEWLRFGRAPGKYKLPGGHGSNKNDQRLPGLRDLYEAILQQAPGAQLIVVGYPKLFETGRAEVGDCQVGTAAGVDKLTINNKDVEWIDQETDLLDGTIETAIAEARAATGGSIAFADPRVAFTGRGLCDVEPSLINPLLFEGFFPSPKNESFHPTAEGQEVLRELVEEAHFQ